MYRAPPNKLGPNLEDQQLKSAIYAAKIEQTRPDTCPKQMTVNHPRPTPVQTENSGVNNHLFLSGSNTRWPTPLPAHVQQTQGLQPAHTRPCIYTTCAFLARPTGSGMGTVCSVLHVCGSKVVVLHKLQLRPDRLLEKQLGTQGKVHRCGKPNHGPALRDRKTPLFTPLPDGRSRMLRHVVRLVAQAVVKIDSASLIRIRAWAQALTYGHDQGHFND